MKKWFLFLIFIACAIPSCELKEVGPEQTTFPVITDEGATIEDGGRVSSVQKVYVQANISNQYGAFYAQVKYDVKWTDKNGVEHTEQKSTNAYYFKATSDTVFYEAIIPAQKAGSTVYWLIVVTNENGLSSVNRSPAIQRICHLKPHFRTVRAGADSPRTARTDSEEPNSNILSKQKKLWN